MVMSLWPHFFGPPCTSLLPRWVSDRVRVRRCVYTRRNARTKDGRKEEEHEIPTPLAVEKKSARLEWMIPSATVLQDRAVAGEGGADGRRREMGHIG